MEAIAKEFENTVVFLCIDEVREQSKFRIPKGTGFLVRVPSENNSSRDADYIVTARHCLDEARENNLVYIRMNCKVGKYVEFPAKVEDWYSHTNSDVAAYPASKIVFPKDVKPKDLDIISININSFVKGAPNYDIAIDTEYGHKVIQPRVGHQVYLLGLFTEYYGEERNLPIARFGHISHMPEMLNIAVNDINMKLLAYLIEFQSFGGLSGSPVFYLYPMIVEDRKTVQFKNGNQVDVTTDVNLIWHSSFMGVVSGHYNIKKQAETPGAFGDVRFGLNSGIAFVTPADAVRQLLMRDDLVQHRARSKS